MLSITWPAHGKILNHHHGEETAEGLRIAVRGTADPLQPVTVNGQLANRVGAGFEAMITLQDHTAEISAQTTSPTGVRRHVVQVIWDRQSFRRYNFYIDDNIFFLDELAQKRYRSLFDCFYLAALRDLHDKYGTKFTLNCFYRNDHGRFNLSQCPNTYRSEWEDNAHWLHLAFHAYSEFPDRPYQSASADKLAEDYDLVQSELVRIAGERTVVPPNVVHWNMVRPAALRVLYERGVRALCGQFVNGRVGIDDRGDDTSYLDLGYFRGPDEVAHLLRYGAWHDFDSGITFVKSALCSNLDPCEATVEKLQAIAAQPDRVEAINVVTHEQYSFPFYKNYLPDHFKRMETAVRWLKGHGYQPVFFQSGFLGNEQRELTL